MALRKACSIDARVARFKLLADVPCARRLELTISANSGHICSIKQANGPSSCKIFNFERASQVSQKRLTSLVVCCARDV